MFCGLGGTLVSFFFLFSSFFLCGTCSGVALVRGGFRV